METLYKIRLKILLSYYYKVFLYNKTTKFVQSVQDRIIFMQQVTFQFSLRGGETAYFFYLNKKCIINYLVGVKKSLRQSYFIRLSM